MNEQTRWVTLAGAEVELLDWLLERAVNAGEISDERQDEILELQKKTSVKKRDFRPIHEVGLYNNARDIVAQRMSYFYGLIFAERDKGDEASEVKIDYWKSRVSALYTLESGIKMGDRKTAEWVINQNLATPRDTNERQIF